MVARGISAVLFGVALCTTLPADDWPQWLGPGQTSTWRETGLVDSIPPGGIPIKWRREAGLGYAGPAVAGGRVYLFDYERTGGDVSNNPNGRIRIEGRERLQCLSAADGAVLWQQDYEAPYDISYPSGPRATPTVDDDRVYTLGAEGRLVCRKTSDGAVIWDIDLKSKYGVPSPLWGFSAAPLVDGDRLIVLVGGTGHAVVALDKRTGQEQWRALKANDAGYAAPTIIEAGGKRQLIAWLPDQIHSLEPETGKEYWSIDLKPDYGMSIMVPRKSGDELFASGIGNVGAVLKLAADHPAAEVAWRGKSNNAVYCANSTPVIVDGVIYGCDCRAGSLMAVSLENGERLWETMRPTVGEGRKAGHGTAFLVRQDGTNQFWIFSETGDLILARLTREKYDEVGRFHLLDPTNEAFGRPVVWSHPAFADRCVFARNDREIVCVSLAK